LPELVTSGAVPETFLDDAVRRILTYKVAAGLFDDPYRYVDPEGCQRLHLCAEHRAVARDAARRSLVLLENKPPEGWTAPLLPLTSEKLRNSTRIALIGPLGRNPAILGAWSARGNPAEAIDLATGLEERLQAFNAKQTAGAPIQLVVEPGCAIDDGTPEALEAALECARGADLIILAVGESASWSGEARSRVSLRLPPIQEDLVTRVGGLGKPTAAVLFSGRPLVLETCQRAAHAIVEAWFPGTEGGPAIAEVLFGDYNPAGKLSISFPRHEGQVPVYYNHLSTGRPLVEADQGGFVSRYLDAPNTPLYPFGYGKSYSEFRYADLVLGAPTARPGDTLEIAVTVENLGPYPGEEVVQLYVRDQVASLVRPVKELKGFQKIALEVGEHRVVRFSLATADLRFWKPGVGWVLEPGVFWVGVGPSSETERLLVGSFTIIE
jgi:beta-glucosidase